LVFSLPELAGQEATKRWLGLDKRDKETGREKRNSKEVKPEREKHKKRHFKNRNIMGVGGSAGKKKNRREEEIVRKKE
jgi:hypothetical protein